MVSNDQVIENLNPQSLPSFAKSVGNMDVNIAWLKRTTGMIMCDHDGDSTDQHIPLKDLARFDGRGIGSAYGNDRVTAREQDEVVPYPRTGQSLKMRLTKEI